MVVLVLCCYCVWPQSASPLKSDKTSVCNALLVESMIDFRVMQNKTFPYYDFACMSVWPLCQG